jgi:hypothetical protein
MPYSIRIKQTRSPHYQIMKIIERARQKTPKFFKDLQKTAVVITGIAAAVLASPVALPGIIVSLAGYLATAGAVAAAIAQVTVAADEPN